MTESQQPLANRYRLIRQLAAGSYAETWLATDVVLGRRVAIKLLHASETNQEPGSDQFLREARIAAAVSHPNIVAVFDAGSTDDQAYLVMEWVNGASLKREIVTSRRLTTERAISVTAELLDALACIHDEGIIHRDVKPQNIMVDEFGKAKLTDFGIARLPDEADATKDGTTTGSAAYMAPEQAQGLPVTSASDIYAAGVILYEMLTGRLPFAHDDPEQVIMQHIADPVLRPRRINPAIPAQLEAIVLKALEKSPADRFANADEMRGALLAARTQPSSYQPPFLVLEEDDEHLPVNRFVPRFAWMAASIALMVMMLAGATSLAVRDFGAQQTVAESSDPVATEAPPEQPEETPEPVPTVTKPSEESDGPPITAMNETDDNVIRGEVVIEESQETSAGLNRPAPNREATDHDDDDAEEKQEQDEDPPTTAANTQQPAPQPTQPPPQPTPTATPVPVQTPPADNENQDGDEATEPDDEDKPGDDEKQDDSEKETDDSESDEPGNSGDNSGQEQGNHNGNGQGNDGEGNGHGQGGNGRSDEAEKKEDDDDAPASNQGHNSDDDESDDADANREDDDDDDESPSDNERTTANHQSSSVSGDDDSDSGSERSDKQKNDDDDDDESPSDDEQTTANHQSRSAGGDDNSDSDSERSDKQKNDDEKQDKEKKKKQDQNDRDKKKQERDSDRDSDDRDKRKNDNKEDKKQKNNRDTDDDSGDEDDEKSSETAPA